MPLIYFGPFHILLAAWKLLLLFALFCIAHAHEIKSFDRHIRLMTILLKQIAHGL